MRRRACSACGYDDLEMFLDLGHTPIADAYTATADETVAYYPLQLAVCTGCWLVQLLEVVDHNILFGTGYSFYSSASAPLSDYHAEYARDILQRHLDLAKRLTVEIGCNDGDMLRHFEEAGCATLGVDPAGGPVQVAMQRVGRVLQEPFSRSVAEQIRDEHGPAGVVIANHVLAHVEDVADTLDGVQHLLSEDGVAYIEVQYLPDLLVNNAFDLVYHEHRNFFSMTSLRHAIERWGLWVSEAELTSRQGGSLRVELRRSKAPMMDIRGYRTDRWFSDSERWLGGIEAYRGFQGRVDRIVDRLMETINEAELPIIGYGAPAKATTLLTFAGLDYTLIDHVIDTTRAKQGRFIPGTGIRIAPPSTKHLDARTVLLLAWNYAPTIMRNHPDFDGAWILPIPAPIVL